MAQKQKVIKMHRGFNLNIGVVIFLIIIIYVAFNIFEYLTSDTVAEYEVSQGTIAANHVYHGMILRDETVVYAGQSGYINYYMKNGGKASVNDVIYSIDTSGELSKKITSAATDGTRLDTETLSDISEQLDSFRNSYDSNNFSSVSAFKNELNAQLSQSLSTNALGELKDVVHSAVKNNTFYKKKPESPGIVVYYTDGYEDVSLDTFSKEDFSTTGYSKTILENAAEVQADDAAYKLINSENWNIIFPVSDELAKQLSEDSYVKIRFCKDDFSLTVPFSLLKKDGSFYLNLSLKTAMLRYVNDRFVDVELVVSEESGLKIPNTAITSKEFYTIPKSYFTKGGDSSELSLLVETKAGDTSNVEMVQPTIYYESDTSYYVDDESVAAGDVIVGSNSTTYTVGKDVDELAGVYNINKGYAVFKQIDILSQNENYAIVRTKTAYGVALYDHIALDGSKVKENQLVVK
ncbi:MAG: HlyD family efflux transporter periplasmic adaptor subunit [Lachnospiraceae bacterium]|nr:HlyD family efflux transporter periplasmic adaptor subunit [Lachnospiraceae bacterium]